MSIPTLYAVQSSMLASIGQDGTDLFVRFNNGKTYRYINAASEYDKMLASDSVGKYLNSTIKPNYQVELLD